jgi:alcohol dehydrogenase class IV
MNFEFATAGRILFGEGVSGDLGKLAAGMGRRVLVVTGRSSRRSAALVALLAGQGLESRLFSIQAEPTVDEIRRGSVFAREEGCDLVIGVGGGSALDAAKAIAILVTNPGDLYEYLG